MRRLASILTISMLLSACASAPPEAPPARPAPARPKAATPAPTPLRETPPPSVAAPAEGRRFRVGEPAKHRNLAVYPVFKDRPPAAAPASPPADALTLDEALKLGLARIGEVSAAGDVNRLVIDSTASRPILIVGGEIVRGGKQDRIIAQDVLVPAGATGFGLDVFCVERGRWTVAEGSDHMGGTGFFTETSDNFADPKVRELAALENAQEQVWKEVALKQDAMAARALAGENSTGSYAILAADRRVEEVVKAYVDAIEAALAASPEPPVGFIAAVDGKIMLAEVFGSHDIAAKLRAKAIRSYAVEALSREVAGGVEAAIAMPPTTERAREFLAAGLGARPKTGADAGAARRYKLDAGSVAGESCVAGDEIMHATLYAK